jgi:hypothetical protein
VRFLISSALPHTRAVSVFAFISVKYRRKKPKARDLEKTSILCKSSVFAREHEGAKISFLPDASLMRNPPNHSRSMKSPPDQDCRKLVNHH